MEKLHYLGVRFLKLLSTSVTFVIIDCLTFASVLSYDGRAYICIKCHKKLLNGSVPRQAVTKKLGIVSCLKEFESVKSNRIVIVKLKTKIEYKGHVLFETVRP